VLLIRRLLTALVGATQSGGRSLPGGIRGVRAVGLGVLVLAVSLVPGALADSGSPDLGPHDDPFADSDLTYPVLDALASHWAQRSVTVECPASEQTWSADPRGYNNLGYIWLDANWMRVEPDVCSEALNVAGENRLTDSAIAAAILTITHESWHLRLWPWRVDEGRVECQAIRHFKQSVEMLGVTDRPHIDELYSYAWALDERQAMLFPAYRWPGCKITKPTLTW
jgi:hypothetical protein